MSSTVYSSSLQAMLEQAQAHLDAGRSENALAVTGRLLAAFPDAVRIWRVRAAALTAAGRADEAAAAWLRVLDVTPDDADALTGCAVALRTAGRAIEASELSRQALDYAAQDADLHSAAQIDAEDGIARITIARNQFAAGLINRAFAHVRGILEAQPTRADALAVLADLLWHSGVRHITAELCRNLLAAHPNCLEAHAILAAYGQRTGDVTLHRIHAAAVADFDPDHREIAARLGSAVPFPIIDVAVPVAEEPAQPAAEEPAQPAAEEPAQPVAEEPAQPAAEEPAQPAAEEPAQPVAEEPAQPAAQASPAVTEYIEDTDDEPVQIERPEWVAEIVAAAEATREQPLAQPAAVLPAAPEPRPRTTNEDNVVVEPLDWSHNDDDFVVVDPPPPPTTKARKNPRPTRNARQRPEDMLQNARSALADGHVDEAAETYGSLIAKGKLLDEIIDDLDAAALTLPYAKRLHELLGQAHTRKGNIPAALEAYRKAMQ